MSILTWIEDKKRLKLLNAPKYVSGGGETPQDSSRGLWTRCDKCGVILYIKHLKENQRVCFGCSYHLQMMSQERIDNLLDKVPADYFLLSSKDTVPGKRGVPKKPSKTWISSWRPLDETVSPCDPLKFYDQKAYTNRLLDAQERTGLQDAIQTGTGLIDGIPVALAVMDFSFMGGSMGSVVGEKITRCIEYATGEGLTLIIVSASGGARMQEGVFSLMQMAKISSALQIYQSCANLLYLSILTSPTTGGVTASFAMLGDIIFAEPKALIAFAGRRVIEQTLCEDLPDDFQTSEYMLHHGLVDLIVPRRFLRQALSETIRLYQNAPFKKRGRLPYGVLNPITFLTEEKIRRQWGGLTLLRTKDGYLKKEKGEPLFISTQLSKTEFLPEKEHGLKEKRYRDILSSFEIMLHLFGAGNGKNVDIRPCIPKTSLISKRSSSSDSVQTNRILSWKENKGVHLQKEYLSLWRKKMPLRASLQGRKMTLPLYASLLVEQSLSFFNPMPLRGTEVMRNFVRPILVSWLQSPLPFQEKGSFSWDTQKPFTSTRNQRVKNTSRNGKEIGYENGQKRVSAARKKDLSKQSRSIKKENSPNGFCSGPLFASACPLGTQHNKQVAGVTSWRESVYKDSLCKPLPACTSPSVIFRFVTRRRKKGMPLDILFGKKGKAISFLPLLSLYSKQIKADQNGSQRKADVEQNGKTIRPIPLFNSVKGQGFCFETATEFHKSFASLRDKALAFPRAEPLTFQRTNLGLKKFEALPDGSRNSSIFTPTSGQVAEQHSKRVDGITSVIRKGKEDYKASLFTPSMKNGAISFFLPLRRSNLRFVKSESRRKADVKDNFVKRFVKPFITICLIPTRDGSNRFFRVALLAKKIKQKEYLLISRVFAYKVELYLRNKALKDSIKSLHGSKVLQGGENDINLLNQAIELAATESVQWRAFYVHQQLSENTGFLEDFIKQHDNDRSTSHFSTSASNMLFYKSVSRNRKILDN